MADTTHKKQLSILLPHDAMELFTEIHKRFIAEVGTKQSQAACIERLVRREAARQGIKGATTKKGKG